MDIYFILQSTLSALIPLLIVAIGAMICEKSGIVNIALEGIMVFGGFIGIYAISLLEKSGMGTQLVLILGLLIGGIAGAIFSLLHAFAAINLKADQTISGTALNIIAPVLAIFATKTILTNGGGQQIPFTFVYKIKEIPFLSNIPVIGDIFFKNFYITFYIAIAILIIAKVILKYTKLGLRIRACGENPNAADAVGVNIYKVRYFGVLVSGFLAGIGGVAFIVGSSNEFNATVSGYGFLALAVLIFGNWKPGRILSAAFFFGLMTTISSTYTSIPFLYNLGLPAEIYRMVPYFATLIVLAFSSKNSNAPKAAGQIFDKSKR